MQCPSCGFENMPGLTTCVRCRAILTAARVGVHPPRAGAFKPLRRVLYALRYGLHRVGVSDALGVIRARVVFHHSPGLDTAAMALSIVPGLGHALLGRWRTIRGVVLLWAAVLAVGLLFYGMIAGVVLLGAATVLHAWIILDVGGVVSPERMSFGVRLGWILAMTALVLLGYGSVRSLAGHVCIGARAAFDDPDRGIRQSDFLLFRVDDLPDSLPRGAWVVIDRREHLWQVPGYVFVGTARVCGPVLALPGEQVRIVGGMLHIADADGVPFWAGEAPPDMGRFAVDLALTDDQYLVGIRYSIYDAVPANREVAEDIFRNYWIITRSQMRGVAFMIYNPPWRMRWLAPLALPTPGGPPE